jgi:hypothetical protein
VTSLSISTNTAAWPHKKPPTAGEFWQTSRTTQRARSAGNTRKPASVGSGSFLVRSSRQGAVRLEFIRRGIGSGRHPSSRSGRGHICALCPALQRELNELSFAKHPETSPCFDRKSSAHLKAHSMQNLPRHVKAEESLRLGVVSGWYSTKVSGTFVSGPHDSEADCLRKIAEINAPQGKGQKGAHAV